MNKLNRFPMEKGSYIRGGNWGTEKSIKLGRGFIGRKRGNQALIQRIILSYKFKQDVIKKIPQQIVISSLEMKVKELERFLPHHKINLQEQQQQQISRWQIANYVPGKSLNF